MDFEGKIEMRADEKAGVFDITRGVILKLFEFLLLLSVFYS